MYYIESDLGIYNILSNLYLDSHEDKYRQVTSDKLFQWLSENKNDYSEMISGIISTRNPLCIKSISMDKKFFTKITLDDIVYIKTQIIDNMKSNILRAQYNKDFNRIYKSINHQYLKLYDKSVNPPLVEYGYSTKFINNRDSLLLLSDIDNLDKDIEASVNSKIFTIDELKELYSITLRLLLPKYLVDKIRCNNKKSFLYKSLGMKIVQKYKKNIDPSIMEKVEKNIYITTADGTSNLEFLDGNTMYKVYINVSFSELNSILNELVEYENDYDGQVFGNIFYVLMNHKNINLLFDLNTKVKQAIFKKMYAREGN